MKIQIIIGAMAPSISAQLRISGINLGDEALLLDRLNDALCLLYVQQFIGPSQFHAMGRKLIKKTERAVNDQANRARLQRQPSSKSSPGCLRVGAVDAPAASVPGNPQVADAALLSASPGRVSSIPGALSQNEDSSSVPSVPSVP